MDFRVAMKLNEELIWIPINKHDYNYIDKPPDWLAQSSYQYKIVSSTSPELHFNKLIINIINEKYTRRCGNNPLMFVQIIKLTNCCKQRLIVSVSELLLYTFKEKLSGSILCNFTKTNNQLQSATTKINEY